MHIALSIFLSIQFLSGFSYNNNVEFHKGNLESAHQKANDEGKLYFVKFVAEYCQLCKLMDESTWQDQTVIDYIESNYVPVKIDVEDFDGFVLRDKYNITVLPTFLIFNTRGEVLGRYEESMGSSRVLDVLSLYNSPSNKIKSSSPDNHRTNDASELVDDEVKFENPSEINVQSAESVTSNEMSESEPISVAEPVLPETISGEGLFEFNVSRHNSKGYGVQIGVFKDYANVLREVEAVQLAVEDPVLVNISSLDGETVYRVIVGSVGSKEEALELGSRLSVLGYSGMVRDLSKLK